MSLAETYESEFIVNSRKNSDFIVIMRKQSYFYTDVAKKRSINSEFPKQKIEITIIREKDSEFVKFLVKS